MFRKFSVEFKSFIDTELQKTELSFVETDSVDKAQKRIDQFLFLVAAALFVSCAVKVSRIGFNPTDDGFILAQSKRLLDGEIPHLDFVSPRPVGSPLFHVFDILLPFPLIYSSRLIFFLQLLLISCLTVDLLTSNVSQRISSRNKAVAISIVFLLNTHTFPAMSWHTVDGILFSFLGSWILLRSAPIANVKLIFIASLLIGYTPLIKQSFAPMVLLGLWIAIWSLKSWRFRLLSLVSTAIPGFLYFVWMWTSGALSDALAQMTGGPLPEISGLLLEQSRFTIIFLVMGILLLTLTWVKIPSIDRRILVHVPKVLLFAIFFYAIQIVLSSGLSMKSWSTPLFFLACLATLVQVSLGRRVSIGHVVVISVAFMATLSWGYQNTNLLSGGLFLICTLPVLDLLNNFAQKVVPVPLLMTRRVANRFFSIVAIFLLFGIFRVMEVAREEHVYRDLSFALHTRELHDVSSDLFGIRSNLSMHKLLLDVKECTSRYVTNNLAVLPDAAVVPLLFGKENPMRIDWWVPSEMVVDFDQYFKSGDSKENYLILFQTFPMTSIANSIFLANDIDVDSIFSYENFSMKELFAEIPGRVVRCGSLIGKYQSQ